MDVVADVHLHEGDPATARCFMRYLAQTEADALFILGDLFEVWVGDDAPAQGVLAESLDALRRLASERPVYVMHGNRDFLIGPDFHQRLGTRALPDPCLLDWNGHRWLLSHGDAWCIADHDYQRFRAQVRAPHWQADFLSQPLSQRQAVARQLRQASEARKQQARDAGTWRAGQPSEGYADVDAATAMQWLDTCGATVLVHGHTHQPADHALPAGRTRVVLTDWDALAQPGRGGALRLHPDGRWTRLPCPCA